MPTSKVDLSSLSTQELLEEFAAELARRHAEQAPAEDMSTMELALEAEAEALKRASLARRLEQRGNEEDDGCYRARWMREKWARVSELVDGQAPREQG